MFSGPWTLEGQCETIRIPFCSSDMIGYNQTASTGYITVQEDKAMQLHQFSFLVQVLAGDLHINA